MKQKCVKFVAIIVVVLIVCSNWQNAVVAESDGDVARNVLSSDIFVKPIDESLLGDADVMPMDIVFGTPTYYTLQTAATVYYAPYGSGCAPTEYTLAKGAGVYLVGREYDYFYICWYINGKEMYGYVPISCLSASGYAWINYDIYRKANCTATTPVLSNAGTTNSYFKIGEIYAGEAPLMVLGQKVNAYNNIIYYYVQYETSAGLAKRGWVDSSLGTVKYHYTQTSTLFENPNGAFSFINGRSGLALTCHSSGTVTQELFTGALNQTFLLEKAYTNGEYMGFYKIVLASDTSKALSVSGKGYADGLSLIVQNKGEIDKRQEFIFATVSFTNSSTGAVTEEWNGYYYNAIQTRSSGEFRSLVASGNSTNSGATIVHSSSGGYWKVLRVNEPWSGTYKLSGYNFPANYKVYVNSSVLSGGYTLADIQNCLDLWNEVQPELSLTAVTSNNPPNTRRFATIESGVIDDPDVEVEEGFSINGRCIGEKMINGVLSLAGNNENWNSAVITLDLTVLMNQNLAKRKQVLTHELGHALKQSHTYSVFMKENGSRKWQEESQHITLMDQGGDMVLHDVDEYRLIKKWEDYVS